MGVQRSVGCKRVCFQEGQYLFNILKSDSKALSSLVRIHENERKKRDYFVMYFEIVRFPPILCLGAQ